jgi:hypothetical protein
MIAKKIPEKFTSLLQHNQVIIQNIRKEAIREDFDKEGEDIKHKLWKGKNCVSRKEGIGRITGKIL